MYTTLSEVPTDKGQFPVAEMHFKNLQSWDVSFIFMVKQ